MYATDITLQVHTHTRVGFPPGFWCRLQLLAYPGTSKREKYTFKQVEVHMYLASFPDPAQLSVACSTEKRGEPGNFSHVSMTQSENGENLPN